MSAVFRALRSLKRRMFPSPPSEWDIRVQRDAKLTEELLTRCITADTNCIDIGANRGDLLERMVALAPRAQHMAFEPQPAHAQQLRARYPAVTIHDCALSDQVGEATFFEVPERDAWSGLRPQEYPDGAKAVETTVKLARLDDLVPEDREIGFIKIDVEGAELEVLRGAAATLARCRPVVLFEHAKLHNANFDTTPDVLHDLLVAQLGFEVRDLTGSHRFERQAFVDIYERSAASNYDRHAQTNFVAAPPGAF